MRSDTSLTSGQLEAEKAQNEHVDHAGSKGRTESSGPVGDVQSTLATSPNTLVDEKKVLRKVGIPSCLVGRRSVAHLCPMQMDIRLIPMLALLYLLSFLDRRFPCSHLRVA